MKPIARWSAALKKCPPNSRRWSRSTTDRFRRASRSNSEERTKNKRTNKMRHRRLFFVLCSLLFFAGLVEAQRGFRGGWGGEVGAPPKFPNVSDFDGSWHFCRLMYRSVRSQQRG